MPCAPKTLRTFRKHKNAGIDPTSSLREMEGMVTKELAGIREDWLLDRTARLREESWIRRLVHRHENQTLI